MDVSRPAIRMRVNGPEIVNLVAMRYSLDLPHEIVRIGYDAKADVLYAHFVANATARDSEILDADENIILGLNEEEQVVRITILNASVYQSA